VIGTVRIDDRRGVFAGCAEIFLQQLSLPSAAPAPDLTPAVRSSSSVPPPPPPIRSS
jgi:hypothetical protein